MIHSSFGENEGWPFSNTPPPTSSYSWVWSPNKKYESPMILLRKNPLPIRAIPLAWYKGKRYFIHPPRILPRANAVGFLAQARRWPSPLLSGTASASTTRGAQRPTCSPSGRPWRSFCRSDQAARRAHRRTNVRTDCGLRFNPRPHNSCWIQEDNKKSPAYPRRFFVCWWYLIISRLKEYPNTTHHLTGRTTTKRLQMVTS